MEIQDNCIILNGKKAELTPDQLKALGIAPPKKSPFARVVIGENFTYVGADGKLYKDTEAHHDLDNSRYSIANYYADTPEGRKIAHQRAMHHVLSDKLYRYAYEHGGVPKLNEYNYQINLHDMRVCMGAITSNESRFASEEAAEEAIDKIIKPFLKEHSEYEF